MAKIEVGMGQNELLFWMSARQAGSWAQFRSAVSNLLSADSPVNEDEDTMFQHQEARLNLERLGHVEFNTNECQDGWRVAPPVLVLPFDGQNATGFLCGARLPSLVRLLQESVASCEAMLVDGQPDIFRVTAATRRELAEIASRLSIAVQVDAPVAILSCMQLISGLPSRSSCVPLPFGKDVTISRFDVGRKRARWLTISTEDILNARSGLFRLTRFQRPHYFLKRGTVSLAVEGGAGKYFELWRSRRRVLRYDVSNHSLRIQSICRPPMLVDRALTLCSGILPEHSVGTLTYMNIDESTAGLAARVLCQDGL